MNPKKCYESVDYSPKDISMHETAKDYNYISRMILNENSGGEFYMYGSSYGATLAYTAFKYDPFLVRNQKALLKISNFYVLVRGIVVGIFHAGIQTAWKCRCPKTRHRFLLPKRNLPINIRTEPQTL